MTTFRCNAGRPAPRPPQADSPRDIFDHKTPGRCAQGGGLLAGVLVALLVSAAPVAAQQIAVPSGLDISLYDVILEKDAQIARFRFVVPAIDPAAEAKTFAEVIDDLKYVCDSVVVPALASNGWSSGEIVMSVSAKPVDFGVYDADVMQYFQPFLLDGSACVWEDF